MKIILSLVILLALAACGSEESTNPSARVGDYPGTFVGTLEDKKYQVKVKCRYLFEDYFLFRSDSSDAEDSTGDGLVISGDQTKDALAISIGDGDKWFSIGRIKIWEKTDNGVKGSGDLWEQGGSGQLQHLEFKVVCGK
ncbi:MAG TPA: hypothetical protein ENJ60_15810 [Aeromonadales bacterium]|nr:hypothetical protein [Aeromonadales bacterium]